MAGPAETLQVVTASFTLAKLAIHIAGLVRDLVEARSEAKVLFHKILHVHDLAKRIGLCLQFRQKSSSHSTSHDSQFVIDHMLTGIRTSLQACTAAITHIERKIKSLAERPGVALTERINLLWSANALQNQEDIIDTHVRSLMVDLIMLNGLDSSRALQALQDKLLQAIAKIQPHSFELASDEPEREPDSSTGATAFDSMSFEIPDEINVELSGVELDGNKRCPNCLMLEDPVSIAVQETAADEVELLVREDWPIRNLDSDGWTPLHRACQRLDHATVRQLLKSPGGSESGYLNVKTNQGLTALMLVVRQAEASGSSGLAQELAERGCDLNARDYREPRSRSALYLLISEPKTEARADLVRYLVRKGADTGYVREHLSHAAEKLYPEELQEPVPVADERTGVDEGAAVDDGDSHHEDRQAGGIIRKISRRFTRSDP